MLLWRIPRYNGWPEEHFDQGGNGNAGGRVGTKRTAEEAEAKVEEEEQTEGAVDALT